MTRTFVTNGNFVLPDRVSNKGALVIEDGIIRDVEYTGEIPDDAVIINAEGGYVLAGFIDVHLHGGGGYDFMDCTIEAFNKIAYTHCVHGTTSIVPTTVACSFDYMRKLVSTYKSAAKTRMPCDLLGIHLEGPYISKEMSGAQNPNYIRNPSNEEVDILIAEAEGLITRCSCAPEIEGIDYLAKKMKSEGVNLAIAHSNATCKQVFDAYKLGFNHITHLYCSSTSVRKINDTVCAGIIEAAYLLDGMTVELIGDGKHIPKELMQMVVKLKGADKVILITDAMRAAGTDDTESYLGTKESGNSVIIEGGVAKLPDRSSFAGSVTTSDKMFANATDGFGLSVIEVSKMMSLNPARLIGMDKTKGSLEKGKDADIIIMDSAKNIRMVMVNGIKFI